MKRNGEAEGDGDEESVHGVACCVPMLLIAIALVVSGVAKAGAIAFALACTAMMAGMGHGGANN